MIGHRLVSNRIFQLQRTTRAFRIVSNGPAGRKRILDLNKSQSQEQPAGKAKANVQTTDLLDTSTFAIGRQLEMMNVFLGFEQANRYAIYPASNSALGSPATASNDRPPPVGFIAEEDGGLGKSLMRQVLRTHRPFKATVMDADGRVLLQLERPFQFINSRLSIFDAQGELLGQTHQQWHPFRRQYNLFTAHRNLDSTEAELINQQFAYIDAPLLSWDFQAVDASNNQLAFISKNLTGLVREIFTDTSVYALNMDRQLTRQERAVVLATAICIDFDYFSRTSGGGGGGFLRWLPFLIFWE
eukprot:Partr_v1_DN28637_c0_g1_i1_m50483 putative phospholipid scramblase